MSNCGTGEDISLIIKSDKKGNLKYTMYINSKCFLDKTKI